MTYGEHRDHHRDRARAQEQGITEADLFPAHDVAPLDWVAQLPDPWRTVACGVCGRLVAAVDLTRHVTDCASQEAS